MPQEVTKEYLLSRSGGHLTVGELRRFLSDRKLPDDAPVVVQRIEDVYYENHGWWVYPKETSEGKTGYAPASSCVWYPEDHDILFIDLHY